MSQNKILVIDDEPGIINLVTAYLRPEGYQVYTAMDGNEGLQAARAYKPDLIVLDIMLPGIDGVELLTRLRRESDVYVILLTAKADETDKIVGLSVGADDYLTKPFSMEELRARIRAVLRRTGAEPAAAPVSAITVGALKIDLANHIVTVDGQEVHFTPLEYHILCLLAAHPGKIMTHRAILAQVWGADYADMTHYVRIYINQIRKKLHEDPAANVRYILNEPGIGYRFVDIG